MKRILSLALVACVVMPLYADQKKLGYPREVNNPVKIGDSQEPTSIKNERSVIIKSFYTGTSVAALDIENSRVVAYDLREFCPDKMKNSVLRLRVTNSTLVVNRASLPFDIVVIHANNSTIHFENLPATQLVIAECGGASSITLNNNTDQLMRVALRDLQINSHLYCEGTGQFQVYPSRFAINQLGGVVHFAQSAKWERCVLSKLVALGLRVITRR